ncbi:hypothetical protein [Longispora urticae]
MNLDPVTADRAVLVSDIESDGNCRLSLALQQAVLIRAGDTWGVRDNQLYVQRPDGSTLTRSGSEEMRCYR